MIEPHEKKTGRDRFFRLLEQEMEFLIDRERDAIRRELAEETACYLCTSRSEAELFRKQGLRFVRCLDCGLTYMNPRPNAAALERLYAFESEANDAWVDVLLSDEEERFQIRDFGLLLDAVARHRPRGRLLDIGCSVGRLLHLARQRGYEVLGIELGQRAARHAREDYELEVIDRPLHDAGLEAASFDVVTLIETLEHLPEPRAMLRQIRALLRPGGVLLAGVPNGASLGVMVLHKLARTFNRNHLVFFTEETLGRLLVEEGFEVRETSTTVTVLDSVLNHLQMLDPFGAPETRFLPPRLRRLAEDSGDRRRLERLIYDLGLGYRLRIVALRREG